MFSSTASSRGSRPADSCVAPHRSAWQLASRHDLSPTITRYHYTRRFTISQNDAAVSPPRMDGGGARQASWKVSGFCLRQTMYTVRGAQARLRAFFSGYNSWAEKSPDARCDAQIDARLEDLCRRHRQSSSERAHVSSRCRSAAQHRFAPGSTRSAVVGLTALRRSVAPNCRIAGTLGVPIELSPH